MWRRKLCRVNECRSTVGKKEVERRKKENNHRNSLWRKESSVVAVVVATHICAIQVFMHMCPALQLSALFFSSLHIRTRSICSILIFTILVAFCMLQLHNFVLPSSDSSGSCNCTCIQIRFFFLTPRIDFITSGSGQRLLVWTLYYSPNFLSVNASVVFSSVAFDFYYTNEAKLMHTRHILDKIKIMK